MSDYDHDPAEAVDPQADEGSDVSEHGTAVPPGRQRSRARPRRKSSRSELAQTEYGLTVDGETNAGAQGSESGDAPAEDVAAADASADGSGASLLYGQRPAKEQPADEARNGAVEGESGPQRQAATDDGPASPLDDGDAVAGSDNTDYAAQSPTGERSRRERTSRRRRTGDREPGEGAEGDHGARERYNGHSPGTGHGAVAEQLTVAGEEIEPQGADEAAPERAGSKRPGAMKEAAARGLGGLKEKLSRDVPEEPSAEEQQQRRSRIAAGRELLARHRRKALAGAILLAAFGYLGLGGGVPFDGSSEQPQQAEQGQVPDQPAGSAGSSDPGTGEEGGGPGGDSGGASGSVAAEPEITDTGKSFNAPVLEDGEATIESGDRSWEGTVQDASDGERQVISVQGPTNASFETAIPMPSGDMATGAFTGRLAGDAGPEGAAYRATYNRFTPSGEDNEVRAHGEYFISGEDGMIAQGSYVDRREGGDKVVRTYTDAPDSASGEGRKISVSFEAPENALVPELIGYEVAG